MSSTPTWPKITNALGSTTTEFGASDWANLISDYYNGTNLALLDASKPPLIGTLTRYTYEKLALYDADSSHYLSFSVDDIDTGANRKVKFRRMNSPFETDYAVLEGLPQTLINKTIDADLNTITGIANANIKTAAAISYSKLNLTNSLLTADITDNAITQPKLADNSIGTAEIIDANVTLAKLASNSVDSSKIVAGTIVDSDISVSAAIAKTKLASLDILNADVNASAGIVTTKLADSTNFVLTNRTNTFGAFNQTFPTSRLLIGDSDASHSYIIAGSNLAANRTVTLPLLGGNDIFVTEAFAQALTNKSIDADLNTITNIENADIKAAAGIVTTKLADSANFILKTLDNSFGAHYQDFTKMTVPGNPGANDIRLYVDTADTHLKIKNNAGTIVDLHTGGGGATNLDALTDVDLSTVAPVNGDVLTYTSTGTKWIPSAPPGAGGSVTASSVTTFTNKTIDADGTGNSITNIENADIKAAAGIVTTKLADSTNFVLTTRTNTFGAFDQIFPTSRLLIGDSDATHSYIIAGSNLTANRTVTLPLLLGNDIFVTEAFAQTLTNKTLTAPVISTINNTGTLTLPTSTDTLVGKATTDTFTNKTFNADGTGNSITNIENADIKAAAGIIYSKLTLTDSVVNADINSSAGIVTTKLADSTNFVLTTRTNTFGDFDNIFKDNRLRINNPLDSFAYTIVADAIGANRTITLPLLLGNDTMVTQAYIQSLTNKTIDADSNTITNIENADIKAAAGIVYSKLSLSNSILNADVNASAGIAYSKLNLTTSILNADISTSAAIATSKLADSANFLLSTLDNNFGAHFHDITRMTAPANPNVNDGRFYTKQIDANNDGFFVKIKKAGSFVEVQIA